MNTKHFNKFGILICIFWIFRPIVTGQARLKINNDSGQEMTVKIMQNMSYNDRLHRIVTIAPYDTQRVYFTETGNYYTKTIAAMKTLLPDLFK
jgi:hypothetical protein